MGDFVKQGFTEEMREVLAGMKGKTFKSYEGVPEGKNLPLCFYGKFRINLGRESIDFSNLQEVTQFPGSVEEVSRFRCEKVKDGKPFVQYLAGPHFHYMVNERIKDVELVVDKVTVPDENYEIEFDMALVIKTPYNVYTFSRDWYYGESVDVVVDAEKAIPYSIQNVQSDWDNIQDNVSVSRRIEKL